MWELYDPRDDDSRERDDAWTRDLGGRGGRDDRDHGRPDDPRDVFLRELDLPRGAERLRVEGLTREGLFSDVGFSLHAGEIVGIAGVDGNGQSQLSQIVTGVIEAEAAKTLSELRSMVRVLRQDETAELAGMWQVVLHNDDVNEAGYVVRTGTCVV